MLARVLPGGVIIAAALTIPEFSVGAGDTGRGPLLSDPPEPAARPELRKVRGALSRAIPGHSELEGVRYAPIVDLAGSTKPAEVRGVGAQDVASFGLAPLKAPDAAVAVPGSASPDQSSADLALPTAPGSNALGAAAPIARAALAKAPSASVPVERQASPVSSVLPDPAGGAAPAGPASPLAEERAALRAPAATIATAPPGTSSPEAALAASAAAPVAMVPPAPAARTAPVAVPALPPARSAMEQLTPARIAAARAVPAAVPAAPQPQTAVQPAPAPLAQSASLAPPAPTAPPGARGPLAAAVPARPATVPASPAPAAVVAVPRQAPALTAPPAAASAPPIADLDFRARLLTRVDGRARGEVDFRQSTAGLKVRLGSVAEVLADQLPAGELARIRGSSSANAWLSLAELQAQGIPISYDPVYDEFNIGREDTRPKYARKVHIDQIGTSARIPGSGAGSATMDQIRRR